MCRGLIIIAIGVGVECQVYNRSLPVAAHVSSCEEMLNV
jgi:hypothetical protein